MVSSFDLGTKIGEVSRWCYVAIDGMGDTISYVTETDYLQLGSVNLKANYSNSKLSNDRF